MEKCRTSARKDRKSEDVVLEGHPLGNVLWKNKQIKK
jgi:hypothetical protein